MAYHVDSRSEWTNDATGNVASCSDTGQASYVRISTTVTSSVVGTDTKPVVMRGLVAPPVGSLGPSQGTLAVKVSDRSGNPVEGMPVGLSGTTTLSDNTNALGCAVFGYIPAGTGTSYTVTLNSTGWVDQNDDQISKKFPTVTPGNVTLQTMTYDRAGSAGMTFKDSSAQPASPTPAWVMVNNSGWTVPGARKVVAPTATGLFPFAVKQLQLLGRFLRERQPQPVRRDDARRRGAAVDGGRARDPHGPDGEREGSQRRRHGRRGLRLPQGHGLRVHRRGGPPADCRGRHGYRPPVRDLQDLHQRPDELQDRGGQRQQHRGRRHAR